MGTVEIEKAVYKSVETLFGKEEIPFPMMRILPIYPSKTQTRISTSWSLPYLRTQRLRSMALDCKAILP